ncbi:hypothetical protein A6P39_45320 [Streptomyces sp. FXJ1.172]|uniref:hypothetical protein n=1 Tax=Streptomyces sp. FXJ1.172 TaxID=710705 RepID=UPI0007D024E4
MSISPAGCEARWRRTDLDLWLTTGLHTGHVGFTVEIHDEAPPELDLEETDHRVRHCAKGMDAAHDEDTRLKDEPQLDCHLLQFWPAAPAPDRVREPLVGLYEIGRRNHFSTAAAAKVDGWGYTAGDRVPRIPDVR